MLIVSKRAVFSFIKIYDHTTCPTAHTLAVGHVFVCPPRAVFYMLAVEKERAKQTRRERGHEGADRSTKNHG